MSLEARMQALWDGYAAAYDAGDAPGCAAIFAQTAELHTPYGPPVSGRAAIAAAHLDWFGEGEENKVLTVLRAEASGDLASCLVAYGSDVPQPDGPPLREEGVSLSTLRRLPDERYEVLITALVPCPNRTGKTP